MDIFNQEQISFFKKITELPFYKQTNNIQTFNNDYGIKLSISNSGVMYFKNGKPIPLPLELLSAIKEATKYNSKDIEEIVFYEDNEKTFYWKKDYINIKEPYTLYVNGETIDTREQVGRVEEMLDTYINNDGGDGATITLIKKYFDGK